MARSWLFCAAASLRNVQLQIGQMRQRRAHEVKQSGKLLALIRSEHIGAMSARPFL